MATPGRNGHGLVGSPRPLTAAQTAMCQSADGSSLLVASGEKAARIDLSTMQRLADLGPADPSPAQQFYSLASWGVLFANLSENLLFCGGSDQIHAFDFRSNAPVCSWAAHGWAIWQLCLAGGHLGRPSH